MTNIPKFSPICLVSILVDLYQIHDYFCRISAFYNVVIVIPSVLLSTLSLLLFIMPPSATDRNSFAIAIFATFFFLLLIVSDVIPKAASSTPTLGNYFLLNMALLVLAMFLSTLTTKVHDLDPNRYIPKWIEKMLLKTCYYSGTAAGKTPRRRKSVLSVEYQSDLDNMEQKTFNIIEPPYVNEKMENHNNSVGGDPDKFKILAKILDRTFFLIFLTIEVILYFALIP